MKRSIDDLVPTKSSFLTKEDCGVAGKNLTIGAFEQKEVGSENEKETKYCIIFQQADYKPMVLNKENANRLKVIFKTDDIEAMIGGTINVYNDEMVSFGGKIVGGIRIRPAASAQPRPQARPAQKPPARQALDVDPNDELPPVAAYDDDSSPPF